MKKLILLSSFVLLACGNRQESCSCFSSYYERTAKYTIASSSNLSILLYASDWQKIGQDKYLQNLDCDSNGRILSGGAKNAIPIPGQNTYTVIEYKEIATCK